MTRVDRTIWGWNGKGRGFLAFLAGMSALILAWSARVEPGGPLPLPTLLVDANTAPSPVLMALPGLGPALVGRIVEAREKAPFRSIEDFDRRVKGIGPAKVASLRPFLRFDPTPTTQP